MPLATECVDGHDGLEFRALAREHRMFATLFLIDSHHLLVEAACISVTTCEDLVVVGEASDWWLGGAGRGVCSSTTGASSPADCSTSGRTITG